MDEKKSRYVIKNIPYDNNKIYHPNGRLMCYGSNNKINWYLKKGLGKYIDDKFYLTFEPNGIGEPEILLQNRENICVISGQTINLTKHHVIPYQYRKHFPLMYKDKNSSDLLLLTRHIHNEYEEYANVFKLMLENEFCKDLNDQYYDWVTGKKFYNALSSYNRISPAKQIYMRLVLEGICERNNYDIDNYPLEYPNKNKKDIIIVNQVGIENLIVLWKYHFIKYGQPKFLPEWWQPNMIKRINKKSADIVYIDINKNKKLKEMLIKYVLL